MTPPLPPRCAWTCWTTEVCSLCSPMCPLCAPCVAALTRVGAAPGVGRSQAQVQAQLQSNERRFAADMASMRAQASGKGSGADRAGAEAGACTDCAGDRRQTSSRQGTHAAGAVLQGLRVSQRAASPSMVCRRGQRGMLQQDTMARVRGPRCPAHILPLPTYSTTEVLSHLPHWRSPCCRGVWHGLQQGAHSWPSWCRGGARLPPAPPQPLCGL